MSKESFIDNLSIEDLAEMTDKMIRFERNYKERNMRANIFRMIPAVAAIVLILGLINFVLPIFDTGVNFDTNEEPNNPAAFGEEVYTPAPVNRGELFLPGNIEKTFFEERILAKITDERDYSKILAYYNFNNTDMVYVLGPKTSKREKDMLIGYLYEYTDITVNDLVKMCASIDYIPIQLDERYMHVRFGGDDNTLLLEIEWYTYEDYMEDVVEPFKQWFIEQREEDYYINSSDEEKERLENSWEDSLNGMERQANEINEQKVYLAKTINGKSVKTLWERYTVNEYLLSFIVADPEKGLSRSIDSNGYFIYEVYPRWIFVDYSDENGEFQIKYFGGKDICGNRMKIYTPQQYEKLLKNEVIPFCDDLMSRGLITQQDYDYYTTPDWMEYYIDLFFN